jgi:hypothetical protein
LIYRPFIASPFPSIWIFSNLAAPRLVGAIGEPSKDTAFVVAGPPYLRILKCPSPDTHGAPDAELKKIGVLYMYDPTGKKIHFPVATAVV